MLQEYFNLLNYRRRAILQVCIISTKELHLKYILQNQISIFDLNLKCTLSMLKVCYLELYFKYTLSIFQLFFRSILQVYFKKES